MDIDPAGWMDVPVMLTPFQIYLGAFCQEEKQTSSERLPSGVKSLGHSRGNAKGAEAGQESLAEDFRWPTGGCAVVTELLKK